MKKFLIVAISILYCVCLTPIVWYSILYFTKPDKVVGQTYEVGSQTVTTIDGNTISNYFCEISIYDDCYELKFNALLDENKTGIYSQGIQFIPTISGNFDFSGGYGTEFNKIKTKDTTIYSEGILMWKYTGFMTSYDVVKTDKIYDNLQIYNYASADGFQTTIKDLNPINLNTGFKLIMGDEIYLMRFNGDKAVVNNDSVEKSKFYLDSSTDEYYGTSHREIYYDYLSIYRACDITYFAELLFNSIQTLPKGTEQTIIFQFGDLFDYYAYDEENGVYLETTISTDKYAKVIADIKSYYAIKVNIHEGNIPSAKQSIFGHYKGSANYTTEDMVKTDYLYGNTLLIVNENDFTINENNEFILSEKFITENEKYRSSVELKVVIDEEFLNKAGARFTKNSFKDFSVYKILTSTGKELSYD